MLRRFEVPTAVLVGAACLLVALSAIPSVQGAAADATLQLKAATDRVIRILEDPVLKPEAKRAERRRAIRGVADEVFDWDDMAQRALAQHWRPLSPEQRKEFVPLFANLLDRAYMTTIEKYSGEPIQYMGERVEGDTAVVSTKIMTKEGNEVPVVYRMLKHGDRWLIYDVSVEGISLIGNYRTQFNTVIRTSSYDELVRRMRSRVEEFRAPQRSSREAR